MSRSQTLPLLAVLIVLAAVPAQAQDPDTPPPGTVVLGPLRITPSLVVKDMGVDNNVFNEPVDPKRDFTFTITPRAEVGFRVRRLRLGFNSTTDYVYFRKYRTERGVNASSAVRADFDLGRIRPYVSAEGVDTRSRLNTEVDTRARHHDVTYAGGVAVLVGSRTQLLLNSARAAMSFDPGVEFRGVELRRSFDGRRTSVSGGLGLDLTPITRFTMLVTREQQRFELSPERDANTWRVTPGLTFSPTGLLTGAASAGYRRFQTLSPLLPDYSGFVSNVSIGATIYGRHIVAAQAIRDVQYSYEEAAAYYLGTTLGVTWTMTVVGPIDVRGTTTRSVMDYKTRSEELGEDTTLTYGGGIGYRFGSRARLGMNVDWWRRDSDRSSERRFRNHRVFAGLTWGTTQ